MAVSHVDEFISPVTLTKANRKPSRITRSSCRAFCFLQVTASWADGQRSISHSLRDDATLDNWIRCVLLCYSYKGAHARR